MKIQKCFVIWCSQFIFKIIQSTIRDDIIGDLPQLSENITTQNFFNKLDICG